jgi:hypothetical protein
MEEVRERGVRRLEWKKTPEGTERKKGDVVEAPEGIEGRKGDEKGRRQQT